MTKWDSVIFDLDDVLYPEREYVVSGMRAVAVWARKRLGFPEDRSFAELRQLFEQGVRGNTFDRWLTTKGMNLAAWVREMVEVYRQHEPQIALYPGTRGLLRRLLGTYRLGLLSDGYLDVQRRKVAALCLGRYFEAVVYSDELGREHWKPSPRPFQRMLALLCIEGRDAVYVGDNAAKDFRGARQLGMGTIRVRHADGVYCHSEPRSPDDAPDMEIPELGHLETALVEVRKRQFKEVMAEKPTFGSGGGNRSRRTRGTGPFFGERTPLGE